jgi:hypothetical protein
MRKFVLLAVGALVAALGIASIAFGAGAAPNTIRGLKGSVGGASTPPKAGRPASINLTLTTTKTVKPDGTACTPFSGECLLPDIAVHDDIVTSKFQYNGGILKGNNAGQVKGSPLFPVCKGADTSPKNGIPDILEGGAGPGSKCKTIGTGSATGAIHTCGDQSTLNSQTAVGSNITAVVSTYNGGGSKNGNGGKIYGRLVVKSGVGAVIANAALAVTWNSSGKLSFEVPDGLVKPFGACAPLLSTVLSVNKKTGTIKRKIGGKVRPIVRGLLETPSTCKGSKKWSISNTVLLSTGAVDPNTGKVIRDPNNAAVTSATGVAPLITCKA